VAVVRFDVTSRTTTIDEVVNPAVNDRDVVNESHNAGLTVEYDRDTS
jgi:hypothetical protein